MGKDHEILPRQQIHPNPNPSSSSRLLFCQRCSLYFSLKSILFLILSLALFLYALFSLLPLRTVQSEFDATETIKLSATVQANFRLQKPVSELVPHIERLEYDINEEIGVPNAKVAILSMHKCGDSNCTIVVFGVLPDPNNSQISRVSLSVLKASLIEVFLESANLTLTTTIFGQPSAFQILKFPEGITVIPSQSATSGQHYEILFNFTLNNSTADIVNNFVKLKDQLKYGLQLKPYENVFMQVTNMMGSTIETPVTVQASVVSDLGILLPQRLKQLAEAITDSPGENLGLDNSVFGRVKGVILSSYLKHTIHGDTPTPSPSPSPEPSLSPYDGIPPTYTPAPSPNIHHFPPCYSCVGPSPPDHNNPYTPSPKTGLSPAPSANPPRVYHGPIVAPSSSPSPHSLPVGPPKVAPHLSPSPGVPSKSTSGKDIARATAPASASLAPSPSSSAFGGFTRETWLLCCTGLLVFHILCQLY